MTELFRRHRAKRAQGKKGFTLIELIIVIAILAILGTVVGVVMGGQVANAKKSAASTSASSYYGDIQTAFTWQGAKIGTYFDSALVGNQALSDYISSNVKDAEDGTIYVFMDTTSGKGVLGVIFHPSGQSFVGVKGTCGTITTAGDAAADIMTESAKATFTITITSGTFGKPAAGGTAITGLK